MVPLESVLQKPPAGPDIHRDAPFREALTALVAAAGQAPSADNLQPWKFVAREEERRIDVYVEPSRDRFPFNPNHFMALVSCGAAVENVAVLAEELGWQAQIEARSYAGADDDFAQPVASIGLNPLNKRPPSQQERSGAQLIAARVTNRRLYDRRPLSSSLLNQMREATPTMDAISTHWITERGQLTALAPLMARGDATMFSAPVFRRAMLSNVRFDLPYAAKAETGLPLGALELGTVDRMALRGMKFVPDLCFRLGGAKQIFALHSRKLVESASGLCLISADAEAPQLELQIGRAMQRAWLVLTRLGMAAQPMMSLPVLDHALRRDAAQLHATFGRKQIQALTSAFRERLQAAGVDGRPGFLLRFGFAAAPSARTGRLPLP